MNKRITGILCAAALLATLALGGCGGASGGTSAPAGAAPADSGAPAGTVADVEYSLPEGFALSEETDNQIIYTAPDYPSDSSNFNLLWGSGSNPNLDTMTREQYKTAMEAGFSAAGMETEDMVVEALEPVEVNGVPGYRVLTTYVLSGLNFTCLQYIFELDTDYNFTYTDVSEGEPVWLEAFEASAATIEFVME